MGRLRQELAEALDLALALADTGLRMCLGTLGIVDRLAELPTFFLVAGALHIHLCQRLLVRITVLLLCGARLL